MKIHNVLFVITAVLGFLGLGCAGSQVNVQIAHSLGATSKLGRGTVASYATFDQSGVPKSLGVGFSAGAVTLSPPLFPTHLRGNCRTGLENRASRIFSGESVP